MVLALCLGCGDEGFRPVSLEQRLPSGRTLTVTSCLLVWGTEHGERHLDQDSFSLEYVSAVPPTDSQELEREALDAFELIRPVSEQWHFSTAAVSAFRSVERTGKYDIFAFTRSPDGHWSFKRTTMKVFNTESGDKPGHS